MPVRRATTGDEDTLRALRLQAMTDAPEAFGSTYEREAARTTADWARWLAPGATFLLDAPDLGPAGLVAGVHDSDEPAAVHLMAMWVHPSLRGSGAAAELVDALIQWAADEGARTVRLHVMEDNVAARRLYERYGFQPTGRHVVRERDGGIEVEMERPARTG